MSNFTILPVYHMKRLSGDMATRLGWKQVFGFSLLPNLSLPGLHPSLELF